MEELKPCPFCGGEATLERSSTIFIGQVYSDRYKEPIASQNHGFSVRCNKCGCQTCWWHKEKEAIEAWNKRSNIA